MRLWKGHPHDAGFNFDENGDECWHEYGCDLGKYHTPAILFEERAERDVAFDKLARFDALESECSDLRMKTTDALTDLAAVQARAEALAARVVELEAERDRARADERERIAALLEKRWRAGGASLGVEGIAVLSIIRTTEDPT